MRSLVPYLIGLLSIIHGLHFSNALDIDTHIDPCVAKILSCDWYRQSFSLYKEKDIGMFPTIGDLKKACEDQAPYIRCMARAEKFCEKANLSPLAEEMIRNRRFSADVCRPASSWQQLYLNEASCLNSYSRKDFVYCSNKFIGMGNRNPENRIEQVCKYGKAIIDCSATRLQQKCGYYSGIILKKFFKFHTVSDYKCMNLKAEDVDYAATTTPKYDITEAIFNILEDTDFDNGAILEKDGMKNGVKIKLDDNKDFPDFLSDDTIAVIHFDDESFTKTHDSFSDFLHFAVESEDINIEPNKSEFPALPRYHYVHKNRTTFALYEDLEMGYVKYIGCGEADIFWVILSPLRNKYCTLTDLKSEYTEVVFKCTIHMDAACSPKLDDEDISKNAEVFHRRYVASVLTPPNNQRSENMAIINLLYLKIYPSPSMHVPEKKVNLWTAQANKDNTKQAVGRKGSLELEDDHNDIPYQHGNGSGQKRDTDTSKLPHYSDDDEYYEGYKNKDYQPLEDEDEIYFPELLRNDVIYIENDEGELISLHDPRSPIHSNSLYQPHSLFRPRIGAMPAFCSEEQPCPSNSDKLKFGIKAGMYIQGQGVKNFDPFTGMNLKTPKKSSSIILNDGKVVKSRLNSKEVYTVKHSTKISLPKSTESSHLEERHNDESATGHPSYMPEEEVYDDIDIKNYPKYLGSDCASSFTTTPYPEDSKTDSMEPFGKIHNYKFTQSPYTYFRKSTDIEIKPESTISPEDLTTEPSSEKKSMWETYLGKILGNISKTLLKKAEKTKWKLLDKVFINLLETIEGALNR